MKMLFDTSVTGNIDVFLIIVFGFLITLWIIMDVLSSNNLDLGNKFMHWLCLISFLMFVISGFLHIFMPEKLNIGAISNSFIFLEMGGILLLSNIIIFILIRFLKHQTHKNISKFK